jgi:hypothetical protein
LIEGMNPTIFHIPDQNCTAESAEVRWRFGERPWIYQRTLSASIGGEMLRRQQVAVSIEDVDYSPEWCREPSEGNKDFPIDIFHLENGVPGILGGNVWVSERADLMELATKYVDPIVANVGAIAAICRVENELAMAISAGSRFGKAPPTLPALRARSLALRAPRSSAS